MKEHTLREREFAKRYFRGRNEKGKVKNQIAVFSPDNERYWIWDF